MIEFADFWNLYPKRVAKKDAEKAWKKLTPAKQEAAMNALPAHIENWAEMEFVPYPATWLNGERWEDELSQKKVTLASVSQAWWSSEEGTLEYGRTKGISARPGESMSAYRARLKAA